MRRVKLNQNDIIAKCPKCGNNTEFEAHSAQVSEDCCEGWVVCECGFDPTSEQFGSRYEDVWGGTNDDMVRVALECWSDSIFEGSV